MELETIRLLTEGIALMGLIGTGAWWLGKRLALILRGLEDVKERLDVLNGTVARHDRAITHLQGRLGLPYEED